jgi:hypothetical protein
MQLDLLAPYQPSRDDPWNAVRLVLPSKLIRALGMLAGVHALACFTA